MKCENCGVSMFDKPLSRTKPKGKPDAGWMCQDCLKTKEPELYKNLKEDGDFKITNDIFDAVNPVQCLKCQPGMPCPICNGAGFFMPDR